MTNKEKAIKYMHELDLEGYVEKNFLKGKLMRSCGGMGILYFADEQQIKRAAEIEADYEDEHAMVWHIVEDTLLFGDEKMEVVAYLLVIDSLPDKLMSYEADGKKIHITYTYVDNLTIPIYSEFGETGIAQRAGGVVRK